MNKGPTCVNIGRVLRALRQMLCHASHRQHADLPGLPQVGTESLNMRQAMKIMKEQAAAMAVQAQQQSQEAAAKKTDAEAALAAANADLAEERKMLVDLQVVSQQYILTGRTTALLQTCLLPVLQWTVQHSAASLG